MQPNKNLVKNSVASLRYDIYCNIQKKTKTSKEVQLLFAKESLTLNIMIDTCQIYAIYKCHGSILSVPYLHIVFSSFVTSWHGQTCFHTSDSKHFHRTIRSVQTRGAQRMKDVQVQTVGVVPTSLQSALLRLKYYTLHPECLLFEAVKCQWRD